MKTILIQGKGFLAIAAACTACSASDPTIPATNDDPLTAAEETLWRCRNLPVGPIPFEEVLPGVFLNSEDLAFDGKGHVVARKNKTLVRAKADGTSEVIGTYFEKDGVDIPPDYRDTSLGTRYLPNGNLVVAYYGKSKLFTVSPSGEARDLLTAADYARAYPDLPPLVGPNGVHPDDRGNIWVTDNGTDWGHVFRINPNGTVTSIVRDAPAFRANGVVYDKARSRLFYGMYLSGRIRSIAVDENGAAGDPLEVVAFDGFPDGMVLDACGNLYVVDNLGDALYRVRLDGRGRATGPAELLAALPADDSGRANAQFGVGPGFDPHSLYVIGKSGRVFRVPVGVGAR